MSRHKTPADTLRGAAALMRERASNESIPASPWYIEDDDYAFNVLAPDPEMPDAPWDVARDVPSNDDASPLAEHIASWHPAVAFAVADWLDVTARDVGTSSLAYHRALAVARAYLGDAA